MILCHHANNYPQLQKKSSTTLCCKEAKRECKTTDLYCSACSLRHCCSNYWEVIKQALASSTPGWANNLRRQMCLVLHSSFLCEVSLSKQKQLTTVLWLKGGAKELKALDRITHAADVWKDSLTFPHCSALKYSAQYTINQWMHYTSLRCN